MHTTWYVKVFWTFVLVIFAVVDFFTAPVKASDQHPLQPPPSHLGGGLPHLSRRSGGSGHEHIPDFIIHPRLATGRSGPRTYPVVGPRSVDDSTVTAPESDVRLEEEKKFRFKRAVDDEL